MANADQQETSQETSQETPASQGNNLSKVETELASVRAMLEQMNQAQAAQVAQQAAMSAKPQKVEIPDPTYDPVGYQNFILKNAEEISNRAVTRERELNVVVYDMSQRYPEIATDAALKKAIQAEQAKLPKELQGTPQGYKAAILSAVSDAGLVPKDKRPAALDEDISLGGSRGQSGSNQQRKGAKAKVSAETLEVAALLGRDINDPKVLKGLEAATQRTKWSKFE